MGAGEIGTVDVRARLGPWESAGDLGGCDETFMCGRELAVAWWFPSLGMAACGPAPSYSWLVYW